MTDGPLDALPQAEANGAAAGRHEVGFAEVGFTYPGTQAPSAASSGSRSRCRPARTARPGRAVRRRQDDHGAPAPAVLGSAGTARICLAGPRICGTTGSTPCAEQIALVAQDTYLFNDTLRANILIARPDASEAEIEQAIGRAALQDFVAALPDGLETRVGERGTRLSGGQRQRVAVARAFLKNAPILILDEATSHLDAVSETLVRDALSELMADRTTLVIAHRLSTVRTADKIAVLDDGQVVESGNHQSLLARGGLYAALVARQLNSSAAPTRAKMG